MSSIGTIKNLPEVGSKIEVITRHKSHYYFSNTGFDEYRYIGEVINGPKWMEHNSFAISSNNPDIDFHIISANNIVDIKYLSGKAGREVDQSTQLFKVKSYTVFKSKSGYRCTCVGFQYHRKCKHIAEVKEKHSGS